MSPLDDLYQLRLQAEESIRLAFVAAEIMAVTRATGPAEFQQATPRVEIKLSIGAANGHRHICPDRIARFDRWRCTLSIQCVTRPVGDGVSGLHEAFCGRVRNFCSTLAQQTWTDTDNFPNHRFAEPLRDAGDTNTLKANEGCEYTVIPFTGTICIRESAWPAA
jgi:hypothetical protein